MFGMGILEIVVILAVALIALGPEKLPGFARQLAGFVNDLRRTATEFQRSLNTADIDTTPSPSPQKTIQELTPSVKPAQDVVAQQPNPSKAEPPKTDEVDA